ncbi:hypothetical protein EON64_00690 [archaeon]|nr:MAG: hypothetical protein EON64_00690 [archaeon]
MKAADLKRLCKKRKIRIKGSETKAVLKRLLLDSFYGSSSPMVIDIPISTSNSAAPSATTTPVSVASFRPKVHTNAHSTYNTRRSSLTPLPSLSSDPASTKKSPVMKSARKDEKQDGRGSAKRQKGSRGASPVATPSASALSPIASISTSPSVGGKQGTQASPPQRSTAARTPPVAASKQATSNSSAVSVSEEKSSSNHTSQPSPVPASTNQQRTEDRSHSAQSTSSQPALTLSSDPSQSVMNTEESDSDAYESVQSDSIVSASRNSQTFSKAEEMHMADDIVDLLDSDDDVPAAKPTEETNKMDDGASQVSSLHETIASVQPISEASMAVQAFSKLGSKLLSASATTENESIRSASNLSLSEREYELLKLMLEKVKPPTLQPDDKAAPASASSTTRHSQAPVLGKVTSPVVSRLSFQLPPPPPPSASSHFMLESATKPFNPRLSFEGANWTSRESFMPTSTEITPVKPVASTLFGGESKLAERLPTPYHRATASELKKRALEDMDDGGVESTPYHKKELITTSQGNNVSRGRFSFTFNSNFMAQPSSAKTPSFSLGAHDGNNQVGMSYIQRRRLQRQSTPSAPPSSDTAKRILEALSELKAPKEPLMIGESATKPLPQIPIKPVSSIPVPAPSRVSFTVANSDQMPERSSQPRVSFDSNGASQSSHVPPPSIERKLDEQKAPAKESTLSQSAGKSVRFDEQPVAVQDGEFSFEEPMAIEDLDDVSGDVTQTNNFIKYTFSPGTKKRRQEEEVSQSGAVVKKVPAEVKEGKEAKKQDSAPSGGINIWAASSMNEGIKCETCFVRNKKDATRCVSCETPLTSKSVPAPGKPSEAKPVSRQPTAAPSEAPSIWAKAASSDTIKCQACLVPNKKGVSKCVACETALDNTGSQAATSSAPEAKKPEFSWSSTAPKTDSSAAIGSQGFTFAPAASTAPAASFGAPAQSNSKPSTTGFTFGSAPASSAPTETSKPASLPFGASAASSLVTSAAPASSSSSFAFGAPPATVPAATPSTPAASGSGFSFGAAPSAVTSNIANDDDDGALRRKKRRDYGDDEEGDVTGKKAEDLPTSFNPSAAFPSSSLSMFSTRAAGKPERSATNATDNTTDSKPAFSFSLPATKPTSVSAETNVSSSFTFGSAGFSAPSSAPTSATVPAPAPASTFSVSGFSFAAGGAKDANPEETEPKETTSVALPAPSVTPSTNVVSTPFTFGPPANKTVSFGKTEEPSASFSLPATSAPPFAFGGSSGSSTFAAPAQSAPAMESKPMSFGGSLSTPAVSSEKPAAAPAPFTFGASNSTSASFPGAPFSVASSLKVDSAPKPFSFGVTASTSAPMFGTTPASSSQSGSTSGFALGSSAKATDMASPGSMDMMGTSSTAAPIISSAPFGGSFVATPSGQMFGAASSAAVPTNTGPFSATSSAPPVNPFGGNTANNPFAAAPTTSGGGLFGSTAAAAPAPSASGGLFGAAPALVAPAAFGGFGASNPAPASTPFGAGAGVLGSAPLFGATPAPAPAPSPAFNTAPFAFGGAAPSMPAANAFGSLTSNNSSNSLNSGFPAIPGSAFGGAPAGGGFSLGTADKGEQRRKVKAKRPGT